MTISISEIIVILLVALLVIKPEQLPDVAITLGRWVNAWRHLFVKAREEVSGFMQTVERSHESDRK